MFSSVHDCDISLNSFDSQNSRTRSSGVSSNALHACAASPILSARCVSGACAAGCSAAAASAPALGAVLPVVPSFAAVAAHAFGTPNHGTPGSGGRPGCSQVPRRSLCTKGGVSSLPEDDVSDSGGPEGISSWFAPVHWLLVLVVRSWKTGGSGLISLLVPSLGWELGLLRFRLLEPFLLLPLRV